MATKWRHLNPGIDQDSTSVEGFPDGPIEITVQARSSAEDQRAHRCLHPFRERPCDLRIRSPKVNNVKIYENRNRAQTLARILRQPRTRDRIDITVVSFSNRAKERADGFPLAGGRIGLCQLCVSEIEGRVSGKVQSLCNSW